MGTKPDWNFYRKLINAMKKNGFKQQADAVTALVRVASSVEKEDWPEAAYRLHTDVPQKMIRGDGSDT